MQSETKRSDYQYPTKPTANPLRFGLALWRAARDPQNAYEMKMVEIGFARSRFGRWFARWQDVAATLRRDPRTAPRLSERRSFGPINLDALAVLPAGTLGRVFAEHCRSRGLNPNLTPIHPISEEDWIFNDLYQTHDLWHVTTGWGTDYVGEIGVEGFYIAQLRAPRFLAFLCAGFFMKVVIFTPAKFAEYMDALTIGYAMGQRAEPLFAVNWSDLWAMSLEQVRQRFNIDASATIGEGICATAGCSDRQVTPLVADKSSPL